jgi:hypothetical protein
MKRISLTITILFLLTAATLAQTKNPISSALREMLPGRQKNVVGAMESMPADKFSYKPSADQMTFAHLAAHIADSNNLFCSGAAAVPAPKVDKAQDSDSKDKLVAAVKASFDFCSDALSKMDDSKLGESTDFFGQQATRARIALILASSWADHYAEASMYLRLNGVLPPSAKK